MTSRTDLSKHFGSGADYKTRPSTYKSSLNKAEAKLSKAIILVLQKRIRMFMGLPDPDPLVSGTNPDPSIIKQNSKKKLDSYCFVALL
jgi:hypothetical protein